MAGYALEPAWASMAQRFKPQQGDEARLFAEFNDVLMRKVARRVNTSPEVIEDACALAWAQFLVHQPDRQREWRSWLIRTAEREAWRIDRWRYETLAIDPANAETHRRAVPEPADPADAMALRVDLDSAIHVLEQLPARLRRIAFLRAAGLRYKEIGEITGDSCTRINQLVTRANYRIHDTLARMRESDRDLPPRVQRLKALEDAPPRWLTAALGRPPGVRDRRGPHASRLLAWRRAALAIDDYRTMSGFDAEDRTLGERPSDPAAARAYDLATRAIERLERSRSTGRGID